MRYLKSRTVWTIIALMLINGIPGVQEFIPAELQPFVSLLLGCLAVYFRIKPKQQF